jgi:uncharacterized protein (DUF608 family)
MKDSRRAFLKKVGAGTLGTSMIPFAVSAEDGTEPKVKPSSPSEDTSEHKFNGQYTGEFLSRIAFPLGGMGAGMFCIEGTGSFSHMSIRHKPEVFHEPGMFAAVSVKGFSNGAKIIEGPVPEWKKFGRPDAGNGAGGSTYGLPRFENVIFKSRFPFATLELKDTEFPLTVEINSWSPFIPLDADSSSLPVAALVYRFKNTSGKDIESIFSFHSRNFLKRDNEKVKNSISNLENGFILHQDKSEEKPFLQGDFALFTDQPGTVIDHCWFRGGWFDSITMTWQTVQKNETRTAPPVDANAPGASLYVPFRLKAGEEKEIIVHASWYVPASDTRFGEDVSDKEDCEPGSGCCNTTDQLGFKIADAEFVKGQYRPWYASRFKDISEVSAFWKSQYADLYERSKQFSNTFYDNTLPEEVVEAVAANLSILKSPTVLRQLDGRLWSFEGCGDNWGCCHGSCTHVWNYAQAIPHLFPELERTLRHTEFCESQNREGHQTFRASLPIRPLKHEFHAAADGQLGGIMKVYREWRISGDTEWLKKMYPLVKTSLDYCQNTWDPGLKGVIEEPHHNTYDIEFWGPDGMCTSFYVAALQAITEMARFLRKKNDVTHYQALYEKGKMFLENELFDGEYFIQKIQTRGLKADPLEIANKSMVGEYSDEARSLLEKEGPKYQYGSGCLSDGVLGAWIARMCGLPDPFDSEKIASHIASVYKYNFRKTLEEHANPQRPSFAFGNEGGLLLCSWPKGGMLSLPFVYSNEVWTGIEYQVASHLMLTGKVQEGLQVVRACRQRYDGRVRNPFNEYECGHWYARALASFGLLQGLTGVRFDAVNKTLYIDSKIGDFTTFLCTGTGYGTVSFRNQKAELKVISGKIPAMKINISGKETKL